MKRNNNCLHLNTLSEVEKSFRKRIEMCINVLRTVFEYG